MSYDEERDAKDELSGVEIENLNANDSNLQQLVLCKRQQRVFQMNHQQLETTQLKRIIFRTNNVNDDKNGLR